jgi:hypothetical protein
LFTGPEYYKYNPDWTIVRLVCPVAQIIYQGKRILNVALAENPFQVMEK